MGHQFATWTMGPLLVVQGLWVRKRTPILPEAKGPRHGERGTDSQLKLLVVGDSAAAGVGVSHLDQALLGQLVSLLATRYRVTWRLIAKTGATTASTLETLKATDATSFDLAITSLGVNDVVSSLSISRWISQQRRLRAQLRNLFSVSRIIVSGLPPVATFPALPQPLRWYLGRRARQFSEALASDVEAESDVRFLRFDAKGEPSQMASDGFHPGHLIYQSWAQQAASLVD